MRTLSMLLTAGVLVLSMVAVGCEKPKPTEQPADSEKVENGQGVVDAMTDTAADVQEKAKDVAADAQEMAEGVAADAQDMTEDVVEEVKPEEDYEGEAEVEINVDNAEDELKKIDIEVDTNP